MKTPQQIFGLLATLPLLLATQAAHITFNVPPSQLLPNPATLPASTHATLFRLDSTLVAPITRYNTFDFKDVGPGSYLYTVQCRDFSFPPYRVDVTTEAGEDNKERVEVWQTFWGNEWGNKGEKRASGSWSAVEDKAVTVETQPDRPKVYYEERRGFQPLDFLKSPMILMALFSLVMIFGLPYLTENMDEETKKEFEEIQSKSPMNQGMGNTANAMQNFDMAGWLAGKSS